MQVSLNLHKQTGCQPLRFGNSQKAKTTNAATNCCSDNLDQKYDLACRIIALQKQQILALQGKNKK